MIQSGAAGTAFVCELVSVAYNAYIRFDIILVIRIQEYGKWSDINFAGAAVPLNIVVDDDRKLQRDALVPSARWRHHVHLTVNQLCPLAV